MNLAWDDLKERYNQYLSDFLTGRDTEDVFTARLYGLGYRGRELQTEVWLAKAVRDDSNNRRN
jgi:hypothetical protein